MSTRPPPPPVSQPSLFDDDPPGNAVVRVGIIGTKQSLTKAQKTFNRLTARIETRRTELTRWREFLDTFRSRIASDYEPLQRRMHDQRVALLQRFDQACESGALGKRERTRLGRVILDQVSTLLEDSDDPALIALHDKYGEVSHEDLRQEQAQAFKAMVEETLGASFDDDLRTPDDVMKAAERWLSGEDTTVGGADRDRDPAGDDGATAGRGRGAASGSAPGRASGPRAARAQARVEREKALAEGATQSLREAYRKLASALHPDREPDPAERQRKTELMQQANRAYEARDLMQLLTLQIAATQVDLKRLAETSDARLEQYNRILKEQVEAIEQEIDEIVTGFEIHLPARSRQALAPAMVLEAFERDVAVLRRDCKALADDLAQFKDILVLKAWLKTLRISRTAGISVAEDPFVEIDRVLAAAMAGGPDRRGFRKGTNQGGRSRSGHPRR